MNDMQRNRARIEAALSAHVREAPPDLAGSFLELYSDDIVFRQQGRDWFMAGGTDGKQEFVRCMSAVRDLFRKPIEFWFSRFWVLDGEHMVWWWRSRATTFRGEPFSNSGLTLLRWRDDLIVEHHEYTDTAYLEQMLRGWRDVLGATTGSTLKAWPEPLRFPDPGAHV